MQAELLVGIDRVEAGILQLTEIIPYIFSRDFPQLSTGSTVLSALDHKLQCQ